MTENADKPTVKGLRLSSSGACWRVHGERNHVWGAAYVERAALEGMTKDEQSAYIIEAWKAQTRQETP